MNIFSIFDTKNSLPKGKGRLIARKKLPEDLEPIVLSALNLFPKLLLSGGCSLYMIDVLTYRLPNDIDFCVTQQLTSEELQHFINFFQLKPISRNSGGEEDTFADISNLDVSEEIISLGVPKSRMT